MKTKFIKLPDSEVYMADCLVTQELWVKIIGKNPSYFKGHDDLPVETVSWNDCQEFIIKLNERQTKYTYRLPKEKEWNIACGDCAKGYEPLNDHAWWFNNSELKTHIVKQKKPNKLGFYDILGSVWEWCEDKYDSAGSSRVVRGGGWDYGADYLRSGSRGSWGPEVRSYVVGFRLVRTRRIPLPSSSLSLDSDAISLALAKVQSALNELKMICGSNTPATGDKDEI